MMDNTESGPSSPDTAVTSTDIEKRRIPDDTLTRDDESSSSSSEEFDPDEQLLAEGGVKDWETLSENGFEPLWIQGNYPGEIPEEIAEYLGTEEENSESYLLIKGNLCDISD